jgi:phosphoribulokinase
LDNRGIGDYLQRRASLREQLRRSRRPILLGVAGDSGTGKTTYTHGICRLLGNDMVTTIALDGYHVEDRAQRRKSGRLPLDPQANHLDLVVEHLRQLRDGAAVEIPIYNHGTGCFDAPQIVRPAPVVIIEGLHALYAHNRELLDFGIYVDADAEIKWRWKLERDVLERGHEPNDVDQEIHLREEAYQRWIDPQKAHADLVIKIHESHLAALANQSYAGTLPENCYHLVVIVTPARTPLPALNLPVNLNGLTQIDALPFMLASVPGTYWGKTVSVTHVDGMIPLDAMQHLESNIMALTGISAELNMRILTDEAQNSTMRFTQSLVAWPFLGRMASLLDSVAQQS